MGNILDASHISKKYGSQTVLADISLTVKRGEAVAIVGENGCGKSTLLRVLCGATKPSGGNVTLARGAKAALIPDRYEKINMTAHSFLSHMAAMEQESADVLKAYYRAFFLEGMTGTPMKFLSKGTLQKVAVIQAL
jgi:ABC-type multidrug transport system ATPase subunit